MKRRSAIKLSLGSIGLCLSGVTFSTLISSCNADNEEGWTPKVFNKNQMRTVKALVDIIIPRTGDVPGAVDALVHRYVDEAVSDYFSEEERTKFIQFVDQIDVNVKEGFSKPIYKLDAEKQNAFVQEWADSSDDYQPSGSDDGHSFLIFRDFVTHAFFTSEVGSTEVLNYDPVPGEYLPCTDLPENGASWSIRN